MKYKLFNINENNYIQVIPRILISRGINTEILEDWIHAKNPNEKDVWQNLDQIKDLVLIVHDALNQNWDIDIIVDSDADGFTSAAIFINYLTKINKQYVKDHIHYYLHTGKQHGLSDMVDKITAPVVIIPDAGSNDYEEHEQLFKKGTVVGILDHHEAPHFSSSFGVFTVNNQLSKNYQNKNFSGAGITYRFCQAFDAMIGYNFADEFLDLAALGNLSDMMDYRSLETRHIINKGLHNIHNPFFYYMIEKNQFSIDKKGGVNYNSIAWYVTPFINAVVRSGTQEEKLLVFESMLTIKAFDKIESGKRGHKGEFVPRVEEAVRIATNVKSRQNKLTDSSMALLEKKIKDENLLNNSIIICLCNPGDVEANLAGLVANKIQAKYQRPCLVLIKGKIPDKDEYIYAGSARNYSMSEIQNLREICEKTGVVNYATGHEGAFGISISEQQLDTFIEKTNMIYKDVDQEPVYYADYIWSPIEVSKDIILELANMQDFWGQEIPETSIVIKDIILESYEVTLMSPDKNPTIKIILKDGISLIKFKSSEEEYEEWIKPNKILTIIGKPNINEWNGIKNAQILIDDYELREEWVF